MRDRVLKIHKEEIVEVFKESIAERGREEVLDGMRALQVAVYVATGGGMIGRLYAEQPADAYVDARVGRLPYPAKAYRNMKEVLCAYAEALGLDPHNLPRMPDFHASGVF